MMGQRFDNTVSFVILSCCNLNSSVLWLFTFSFVWHSEQTLYGKGCSNVNAAMSHKQFLRPAIDQSIFSMLSTDSATLRQKKGGQFQERSHSFSGKIARTTLGTLPV